MAVSDSTGHDWVATVAALVAIGGAAMSAYFGLDSRKSRIRAEAAAKAGEDTASKLFVQNAVDEFEAYAGSISRLLRNQNYANGMSASNAGEAISRALNLLVSILRIEAQRNLPLAHLDFVVARGTELVRYLPESYKIKQNFTLPIHALDQLKALLALNQTNEAVVLSGQLVAYEEYAK